MVVVAYRVDRTEDYEGPDLVGYRRSLDSALALRHYERELDFDRTPSRSLKAWRQAWEAVCRDYTVEPVEVPFL